MRQSGREQNDAEDELHTEINESANAGFVRGAKRLRLGAGADDDAVFERGRSFLETKWEMEATMKRREYSSIPCGFGSWRKANADCDNRKTSNET